MKQEIIKVDLTPKSVMELQMLGTDTTVDLKHLPFTDFTLCLPVEVDNFEDEDMMKRLYDACVAVNEYNGSLDEFVKEMQEVGANNRVEISVSFKDGVLTIKDGDSWLLETEVGYDTYNFKKDGLKNPMYAGGSDMISEAFFQQEEVARSIMSNLPLSLGVIAFLQSDKKEEVRATTKIECKKKKGKKGSKSNSKKTYIYNKKYVFSDDTVSKDETDRRAYDRKVDEWFTKGHWRHYKSGKKVWIDKTVKKARTKTVESNKPVEKEYKITKVK